MGQATLSMRVDDTLKKKFDMICDDFGFTSTAAITVFMKTVVRERRIPFEIKASGREQIGHRLLPQECRILHLMKLTPRYRMPAMKDKIFAVIDTNVIVSALLSSNLESNPVKVFRAIVQERIVPLYNEMRYLKSTRACYQDRSSI